MQLLLLKVCESFLFRQSKKLVVYLDVCESSFLWFFREKKTKQILFVYVDRLNRQYIYIVSLPGKSVNLS